MNIKPYRNMSFENGALVRWCLRQGECISIVSFTPTAWVRGNVCHSRSWNLVSIAADLWGNVLTPPYYLSYGSPLLLPPGGCLLCGCSSCHARLRYNWLEDHLPLQCSHTKANGCWKSCTAIKQGISFDIIHLSIKYT